MYKLKWTIWTALLICFTALGTFAQSGARGNLTASSTDCGATNACITTAIPPGVGGATFKLSGTFSETVQFEASADPVGTLPANQTWVALSVTPSNSATTATSTTTAGVWQSNVAGYTNVRMRCSTFGSGTGVAAINLSTAAARGGSGGGAGGSGTISGCSTANGVLYNSGSANTATCGANFEYIASTKELYANIDGNLVFNNSGTGNLFLIDGTTGQVTPIGGEKFALTAKACFYGSTGQACIIGASGAAGTPADLVLPTTSGTSGYFLQTDGAGDTSWAAGGRTICSGQISLSTGAIGSGARATNTLSCTGLLTTDTISCTFSGDTNAVTGYAPSANGGLFLKTYVTADTVNVDQVNDTLLSITPGAATVNCRGTR